MALDLKKVPSALVHLLPMAERWGIGDDFEREEAVASATVQELSELVHCIDGIGDDDLYGWLSGEESYSANPSAEYLAITCLTMAIDSARLKLEATR